MYYDSATLCNRWFGAPCEDSEEDIGPVAFEKFNLEFAKEKAKQLGYELDNEYEDYKDGFIITIFVKPTMAGAEVAWINFIAV